MSRREHHYTKRPVAILVLVAAISIATGCSRPAPTQPQTSMPYAAPSTQPVPDIPREESGLRVLFIGNSLTMGNQLPEIVAAMGAAGGHKIVQRSAVLGGFSLEDHWNFGLGRDLLTRDRFDYVVLQQGSSSQLASQAELKKWAIEWAIEIRAHGAKPALYMVWPHRGQASGFDLVSASYRGAAIASRAALFPAGEAWEEALRADPNIPLYLQDGLHPTPAGRTSPPVSNSPLAAASRSPRNRS
jgi:hypothetical protein